MPKSMTGFGRGEIDAPFGRLIVEIQSVNRKHFEAFLQLPKELFRFENQVRKWIGATIFRGHLTVRIQLVPSKETLESFLPDAQVLKSLRKSWESLSKDIGIDPKEVSLPFLISVMPQIEKKDVDDDDRFLQKCVEDATKSLLRMKEEEGEVLIKDVTFNLIEIKKNVDLIEKLSFDATHKMREKLNEKMAALFTPDQTLEDRLLKEIAIFAEKVDISEELTRLQSHFGQFENCLEVDGAIGRKMEFILQEISREVNTIGSKTLDANIAHLIVEIKTAVEKIREQIQNIE